MKKALSVLVLTDHRNHNDSNSIYALCTELRRNPDIGAVHVASRGNAANDDFFYHFTSTSVRAWALDGEMNFGDGAYRFQQETVPANIGEYDWVWLRLPRPIPDGFFAFLRNTIGEERIFNRPSGIEETSSKSFLLQFPEFSPAMKLCRTVDEVWDFQEQFPIVLKPLRNYGGRGIVKMHRGKIYDNHRRIAFPDYLPVMEQEFAAGGYLAMKYLKNVSQGDKRIIVANGEVIGAVLRMPPKGSWLCNAAQGGQAIPAKADARELLIAGHLSEALLPKGIAMFGIDTLVGDDGQRVVSEVNTLSIGGIKPLEDLMGQPLVRRTADILAQYMLHAERPAFQAQPSSVA